MATALEDWLSAPEAARYLGLSRPRIHQLVGLGLLDGSTIAGRLIVSRSSLDLWKAGRGYRRQWRPLNLRELRFKRREIMALASRHGVRAIRVFGSVARGDAGPRSDVDLVIDLEPDRSALDVGEFVTDLEDSLGCDVDVIVASGSPAKPLPTEIAHDAVPL